MYRRYLGTVLHHGIKQFATNADRSLVSPIHDGLWGLRRHDSVLYLRAEALHPDRLAAVRVAPSQSPPS